MDRKRCDETEIKMLIGQRRVGGLGKTAFCNEQGIKYSRFLYRYKQFGQSAHRAGGPIGFVPLKMQEDGPSESIWLKRANGLPSSAIGKALA